MAQASKQKRRERRLKRQVTLLGRLFNAEQQIAVLQQTIKQEQAGAFFAKVMLCTVLAQNGGDVEVTQGTFQQVFQNAQNFGFKTEQSKTDPNAMRVILTEGPQESNQVRQENIVDAEPAESEHELVTPAQGPETAVVD